MSRWFWNILPLSSMLATRKMRQKVIGRQWQSLYTLLYLGGLCHAQILLALTPAWEQGLRFPLVSRAAEAGRVPELPTASHTAYCKEKTHRCPTCACSSLLVSTDGWSQQAPVFPTPVCGSVLPSLTCPTSEAEMPLTREDRCLL